MGDIPIRLDGECSIDYWITANNQFPIPDVDYKLFNKFKTTTLLFAHSVSSNQDYSIIEEKLKIDWFEYDQRHFKGKPCNEQIDSRFYLKEKQECCAYIGDITIQEYLQEKYKTIQHYSSASTVAIHALCLAIILGCKTIYIGGVEIPMYGKNYNYFGANSIFDILKDEKGGWRIRKMTIKNFFATVFNLKVKSAFYDDVPEILNDFDYLNNLCLRNDINLFNVSEKSNLDKIPNFKFLNPEQIGKN